ncbi:MAG: hypothetical protein IRZ33_00805 [Alicyclobacillaceae bacterium]|nr:hypothetical protein [Alicyclobacillaceae bacterium]
MSVIAGHIGMEIALWVVLGLIGLGVLLRLLQNLRGSVNVSDLVHLVTRPILHDVFPLILLSWLRTIDPTHVVMIVWYYLAAVLIVIRAIGDVVDALSRR